MNNGLLENIFNDNKTILAEKYKFNTQECLLKPGKRQCEHCGEIVRAKGIGTHRQGGQCLARRQAIYATLNGYVRAPVEWNRYTASFQKRFWTAYSPGGPTAKSGRTAGNLKQQAWVEAWFVPLWASCSYQTDDANMVRYSLNNAGKRTPTQLPKPEYEQYFIDLCKAKKAGQAKKIDAILGMLELAREAR